MMMNVFTRENNINKYCLRNSIYLFKFERTKPFDYTKVNGVLDDINMAYLDKGTQSLNK